MVTTVKSRPTHYDVLGVTPEASGEEIAQAFAKELSLLRPRPFGSLADVTVAYETLRDAARRRAYDASLAPPPDPLKPALKAPADWQPFLVRPSVNPADLPVIDRSPPRAQSAEPHPLLERLEPRTAPSATAMMREPIRPEARKVDPLPKSEPEQRRPEVTENVSPEPHEGQRALHFFESERGHEPGDLSARWTLPAVGAGILVLAIGLGAWTGWKAGGDAPPDALASTATLKIAPARALPAAEAVAETSIDPPSEMQARPAVVTKPRAERPRPPLEIALPEPQTVAPVPDPGTQEAAETPAAADSQAAEVTQAKLPLPNAVIARTIGRIGYPCGSVASSTALGGGTFTVTCTSGHSYRAAPVRGRYHFRRLGR